MFYRFLDPKNDVELISEKKVVDMPVDIYVGGIEHGNTGCVDRVFISYSSKI